MSNNFGFQDAAGTTRTRKSKDMGSDVHAVYDILLDESGNLTPAGDAAARSRFVSESRLVISVTPTINTAIYATGDAIGGKQTLTGAARGSGGVACLESVAIIDKGNQKAACDILFFDSDPAAATITNNAAFVFSTDISKLVGIVHIATTDWITIDSNAICHIANIRKQMLTVGTANLFVAVVGTGTPTYLTAGDLIFKYGFLLS